MLNYVRAATWAVIVLPAAWLLLNVWTTVKPGYRGVVTLFGAVQPNALDPGFSFINPLAAVHQINVQLQADTSPADAASHDLQQVHTEVTVNYELDGPGTPKLYAQIAEGYAAKRNTALTRRSRRRAARPRRSSSRTSSSRRRTCSSSGSRSGTVSCPPTSWVATPGPC